MYKRQGGFGGGSTLQVWHLTEAGLRLLSLNDPGVPPRKRFFEPSTMFLEHTLAIAEFAVQLTCLCRDSHDLTLEVLDAEPSCWRRFLKFSTSATCTSAITTPVSYTHLDVYKRQLLGKNAAKRRQIDDSVWNIVRDTLRATQETNPPDSSGKNQKGVFS